ncbi:hypothetical protein [Bailinhaonella thermotolerans]|uniref:PLAT domain-containing protein n=1 Tax=Bailinhaonella thermotolerans TaxID=1070861 RepID=A0A3A4A5C3_9ACTN|nr:hypothetical protein [Bailinhaonella thermotolerans]RJL22999.1 hypothetical protein D5H75_34010 [Bailinhaonella thermotolerans]
MAETITIIDAVIRTATDGEFRTGTDGWVYLALAGREFDLDTSANNFEAGATDRFILGDGANVNNPSRNDPRNPALDFADLDRFPAYLRFEPPDNERDDHWLLERADITVTGSSGSKAQYTILPGDNLKLWLARDCGLKVYLKKQ